MEARPILIQKSCWEATTKPGSLRSPFGFCSLQEGEKAGTHPHVDAPWLPSNHHEEKKNNGGKLPPRTRSIGTAAASSIRSSSSSCRSSASSSSTSTRERASAGKTERPGGSLVVWLRCYRCFGLVVGFGGNSKGNRPFGGGGGGDSPV